MLTCNVFMWMCWKARRWYACCCRCCCWWKSKITLVSYSSCGGVIADRQSPNLIWSVDFLLRPLRSWRCAQCRLERCCSYSTDFDSIDSCCGCVNECEWASGEELLALTSFVVCSLIALAAVVRVMDAKQNSIVLFRLPQPTWYVLFVAALLEVGSYRTVDFQCIRPPNWICYYWIEYLRNKTSDETFVDGSEKPRSISLDRLQIVGSGSGNISCSNRYHYRSWN